MEKELAQSDLPVLLYIGMALKFTWCKDIHIPRTKIHDHALRQPDNGSISIKMFIAALPFFCDDFYYLYFKYYSK